MVNDVLFLLKGMFDLTLSSFSHRVLFRFFEWKKTVSKTPYFVYMNEPLINEKHYPDINTDKLLEKIEKQHPGQLPLLAMAGIFDVNRTCEVRRIHNLKTCDCMLLLLD